MHGRQVRNRIPRFLIAASCKRSGKRFFMVLSRMFSSEKAKGAPFYLKTQRFYELARTCIYFGISACLFLSGYFQTGSRANLLTIVAVLGCLPASKSLVSTIMYFRYRGCNRDTVEEILPHIGNLVQGFDFVFTSGNGVYEVSHLAIRGKSICAYVGEGKFDDTAFLQHLKEHLALDGEKEVSAKIFHKLSVYRDRLDQMGTVEEDRNQSERILETIKSITL